MCKIYIEKRQYVWFCFKNEIIFTFQRRNSCTSTPPLAENSKFNFMLLFFLPFSVFKFLWWPHLLCFIKDSCELSIISDLDMCYHIIGIISAFHLLDRFVVHYLCSYLFMDDCIYQYFHLFIYFYLFIYCFFFILYYLFSYLFCQNTYKQT